jgi:hypothetical protein
MNSDSNLTKFNKTLLYYINTRYISVYNLSNCETIIQLPLLLNLVKEFKKVT